MPPVTILVCVVIALSFLQQTSPRLGGHPVVFLGCNLVFLALIMDAHAAGWLAAFLGINYTLAAVARRFPAIPSSALVVPAVICFAVFKKYDILPLPALYAHIPELLGLSYIVFRTLIILFEARDVGKLPSIVSYLNFCLSMVTFLSGPIQRYRAFSEDMERRRTFRLDEREGALALTRLMNGIMQLIYVAPVVQGFQNYLMMAQQNVTTVVIRNEITVTLHSPLEIFGDLAPSFGFGLAAICYLVFLYFNFSGYTDMMIGMGRLLGFRLPENFDRPFAATGFLDFWKRWHISLSLWFRDYCFTPVLKHMVKAGIKDPVLATMPAYFISFGLLGLWHGRTWPFLLCGLMFATGSVANHFYRSLLRKHIQTPQNVEGNDLYQAFATSVTLLYISLSITGLWLSDATFKTVWHSFSALQAIASFTLVVVCLAGILYLGRKSWRETRLQAMVIRPVQDFFSKEPSAFIAAKLLLAIVWLFVFSAHIPDFVYQQF